MVGAPGQIIADKYRLERQLAQGGMGAIWLCTQLNLGRKVALKFARNDHNHQDEFGSRLEREARAAAAIANPHVVQVFDYGYHDEAGYLVMEYLEGEDLGVLLSRRGLLAPEESIELVRQAALGLAEVHRAGFIHRDIKPSNLFLVRTGDGFLVKLLDFGIVKASVPDAENETSTGLILGSAPFMSPEQARGNELSVSSDLWSLSVVFYTLLTGQSPFQGNNAADIVVRICSDSPTKVSELTSLTTDYDTFFERAFSKLPGSRFESTTAFLKALETLRNQSRARLSSSLSGPRATSVGREYETAPLVQATPQTNVTPKGLPKIFASAGVVAFGLIAVTFAVFFRPTGENVVEPATRPLAAAPSPTALTPTEPSPAAFPVRSLPSAPTNVALDEAPSPDSPATSPLPSASPLPKKPMAKKAEGSTLPSSAKTGAATDPIFGLPTNRP